MTNPVEVQGTSQTIAETPTGSKIAAEKAGFKIDSGQAREVATTIREIRTEQREPVYIVTTTGKEAAKESEQARKDNHADYSLVTDKNDPDKKVELDKLDKDKTYTLEQYNIQAFKKVIRTIDVSTNKEATFTISRKITNDGQYLGIGAGYDWENNRVIAKVSYSW
jgi:Tfp pilus assembly protein PilP